MNTPCIEILNHLNAAGYESYFVGGCVRDLALNRTPHDYDIATQATPEQVKQVFSDSHVVDTGIRYGTVTIRHEHIPIEITTFRADGAYSDGRRPDAVFFGQSIEIDLARRDFTVNAMAWNPERGLFDPFGGAADCQTKIIRCVGEPVQRFSEDALRILRALRFACQLGFSIESHTQAAMYECAESLRHIASERITAEVSAMLMSCSLRPMFNNQALFAALAPQWSALSSEGWRTLCQAIERSDDVIVRIAMLCHNGFPKRLRLDNRTISRIKAMHRQIDLPSEPHAMAHIIAVYGVDAIRDLLTYRQAFDETAPVDIFDNVLATFSCLNLKQLAVNGNDLLDIAQGAQIGKLLQTLLQAVIDKEVENERKALLQFARDFYRRQF
ncbi:MAG: CCA tRNA nucleotidyltransferase [Oscillospiraceae bacterium]|nr:CCA tRNA nucleotidyltransferase [Oscillospiraceae bacterium]